MNDPSILADFTGTVRLLPLPNLILFPQVVQGLHIFEPRYRQLVADALDTDRLIALVLLKPGWEEDYEGAPAIESVACLGRVAWHETMPDGRYNLRLRGVARVRILEEVPTNHLYRVAGAEMIPDEPPLDPDASKDHRRALAEVVLPRFEEGPARQQMMELFDGEMPLGQMCDVLAYALPLPFDLKQRLLAEARVEHRAAALVDALRNSAARAHRPFPPPFSSN